MRVYYRTRTSTEQYNNIISVLQIGFWLDAVRTARRSRSLAILAEQRRPDLWLYEILVSWIAFCIFAAHIHIMHSNSSNFDANLKKLIFYIFLRR